MATSLPPWLVPGLWVRERGPDAPLISFSVTVSGKHEATRPEGAEGSEFSLGLCAGPRAAACPLGGPFSLREQS